MTAGGNLRASTCEQAASRRCDVLFQISSIAGGGAERKCTIIANALVRRGFRVALLTTDPETAEAEYPLHPGVERILSPRFLNGSSLFARVGALIRKWRFTRRSTRNLMPRRMVSIGGPDSLLATMNKPRDCEHLIWTTTPRNAPRMRLLRNRFIDIVNRFFKPTVIVQTAAIAREYEHDGWSKVRHIPNPIEIPGPARELPIGASMVRLVTVGRLCPEKSYHTLLDALSRLSGELPSWECVIVGDGELDGPLREQCSALGLDDRVRFVGWQSNIRTWLQQSDIFVMTSLYEGMPNALLEAMSEGLACICTDFAGGAAGELLRDPQAGIVVDCEDVPGLAAAMEKLLVEDEPRIDLGRRARTVAEGLEVDVVTDRWEDMLSLPLYHGRHEGT